MRDRVAILNGFGRSLGDGVIGLQALLAVQTLDVLPGRPVLFRLPGLPPLVRVLYDAAGDMADSDILAWADATPARPCAAACGFGRVIDLRDFAFDPGFRGVAMIDYFLAALGAVPAAVPATLKRNAWLAPRIALPPIPPAAVDRGYVLLCPRSSMPLRDMPDAAHTAILHWLAAHAGAPVLTQASLPPAANLPELCALVAGARLVIATDTAMVHLADAFATPCLAVFTTHRPEWRMRDYPACRAVYRPVPGLPPALEFARDATDIVAAQAAWFDHDKGGGAGLDWLYRQLAISWGEAA